MMCDALGLPVKFILSAGEASDCKYALPLLEGERADYVIADKGYDSDDIILGIEKMQAIPVIPPRSNRTIQRHYDKHLYKDRNLIERLFNRLKQFRRLALRVEKSKINFEALICLACAYLWLI